MLHTIMCAHTELLIDIDCAQCCHVTVLSTVEAVFKKSLRGWRQTQ